MFTGIIETVGTISSIRQDRGGIQMEIASALPLTQIKQGDSIAVSGMCLTVTSLVPVNHSFTVDAVPETIDKTTASQWKPGTRVNLERALALGGRLDGHLVSGHVDGTARVTRIQRHGPQTTLSVTVPRELLPALAKKGSVTLDGVSLTIVNITGSRLDVAVIPFTWSHTTLSSLLVGQRINIEGDMIAKHIAHILSLR
ncbi:riboflavin synthase [Myxococcota bacterium]|nr:riboflavin synthase [Myxococcota bacterium]